MQSSRRESYQFTPTSRMINTYIANGTSKREEMIAKTEKGKIIQPVNQITIGGNFYQMVKDVEEVSSDRWQTDDWENYVKTPAILIRKLKVGIVGVLILQ